jgi:hypothetical protein
MAKRVEGKGYRSAVAGAIHEMMSDAHDAGVVSRETLRTFDEACLTPARALAPSKQPGGCSSTAFNRSAPGAARCRLIPIR